MKKVNLGFIKESKTTKKTLTLQDILTNYRLNHPKI